MSATHPNTTEEANALAKKQADKYQDCLRREATEGARYYWDIARYNESRKPSAFTRVFGVEFDEVAFGLQHGGGDYRRQLRGPGYSGVIVQQDFSVDASVRPAAPPPAAAAPAAAPVHHAPELAGILQDMRHTITSMAAELAALKAAPPRSESLGLADVLRLLEARTPAPAPIPAQASSMSEVVKEVAAAMASMQTMMPKPSPLGDIVAAIKELRGVASEMGMGATEERSDGFAAFAPMLTDILGKLTTNPPQPQQPAPRPAPIRPAPVHRAPLPPAPAAPVPAAAAPAAPQPQPAERKRQPFPAAEALAAFMREHAEFLDNVDKIPENVKDDAADTFADEIEDAGGDPWEATRPANVDRFITYAPDLEHRRAIVADWFERVQRAYGPDLHLVNDEEPAPEEANT